ncbi:MAG: MFS transporter [Rhodobacteraceae bacterium]|nr:MFS transporter [Paracoccaceae bacterium]
MADRGTALGQDLLGNALMRDAGAKEGDGPLRPFRDRRFSIYWLAGTTANTGWLIQMVGASWLMVSLDGTPTMVALVQTALALPVMLFALPAGTLADSFGRRQVILWSQAFALVASLALAGLAFMGVLTPWLLLGLTFLIGCGRASSNPAWQTMVAALVPRKELPGAVAVNAAGLNLARSAGPALGGAIVAVAGAGAAFLANALASLAVVLVALRWPRDRPETDLPPETFLAAITGGTRFVAMSPNLSGAIARAALFSLAAISLMALMPLIARDQIGGGARGYGVILAGFGIGGIVGMFISSRLRARLGLEGLASAGHLFFAAGLLVVAMGLGPAITFIATGISGASWLVTLSNVNATIQMSSPRWVQSRVMAIYQTANFGAMALGGWIWGSVAEHLGTGGALIAAAALLPLGMLLGRRMPLREADLAGTTIEQGWTPPELAIPLGPSSGPVVTTIGYRIAPSDTGRFLALMDERRRQRLRDGARHWRLLRDLNEPCLWRERFESRNGADALRHRNRRSAASIALRDQLRALHQDGPPSVQFEILVRVDNADGRDPS